MCGIVGIVGHEPVADRIVEALKRLEYRGYDSAGVATVENGVLARRRVEGKLSNLVRRVGEDPVTGNTGVGHTRWATHGKPNEQNAHPHANDRVAVVHNGIIENFRALRHELELKGHNFDTETDTEVIPHLIAQYLCEGLEPHAAARAAIARLEGAFALAIVFAGDDGFMIGARRGSPLAVGYGDGEMYLGSDAIALSLFTNRVAYLEDGDCVEMTRDSALIRDVNGTEVRREIRTTGVSAAMVEKGNFRHFMEKEIFEQPDAIAYTLGTYISPLRGRVELESLPFDLASVPKITIVACGTASYAGLTAKYWFEQFARLSVEVDIASEFRYREAALPEGGLCIFVSQSGETADTLAALRYCRRERQHIASIVNVPDSTIARESDVVFPTNAGPEIGVASTKAFTCQLAALAALAIATGRARGHIDETAEDELTEALLEVPRIANEVLRHDGRLKALSHELAHARDVLYLGRGTMYPMALEGALKLKEISYIHAEGYAGGELKHGPIALIDEEMPVVVLAPSDRWFEKTLSNLEEVVARGGRVILISDGPGLAAAGDRVWQTVEMPVVPALITPILYALPVQLIAYHTAVLKGTDVDQPRNLAKSVTVE